jgi:hypothetical protein
MCFTAYTSEATRPELRPSWRAAHFGRWDEPLGRLHMISTRRNATSDAP